MMRQIHPPELLEYMTGMYEHIVTKQKKKVGGWVGALSYL